MADIYTSSRLHFCLLFSAPQGVTIYYLHYSLVKYCGCCRSYQIVSSWSFTCSVELCLPCRWHNWQKLPVTVLVTTLAGLFLSCGFTACYLQVSRYNYPGGHAFSKLHSLINSSLDNSLSETCKESVLTL